MKKRYRVEGFVKVYVTVELNANSKEEAIQKAEDNYTQLENYGGNGGYDKLVGVCDGYGMKASICSDDEINYKTAEIIGEATDEDEDEDEEEE